MRPPVFILGLHRSGTTLLYQMLAASGCFNIVTARHVICFDELRDRSADPQQSRSRVREEFAHCGLSNRGVDAVCLSPDTPEEYGFILDNLNAGMSITRRNFHVFRAVRDVIERGYVPERPLLLKNPWDFGNGERIKTLMPEAKLVYIHRNPFHMLSSLYRVVVEAATRRHAYLSLLSKRYRALVESEFPWRVVRWLGTARPVLLARGLIRYAAWSASGYLQGIQTDSGADRIDVRYETLCRRPNETMARILEYLGATGDDVDYAAMIGARTPRVVPQIARERTVIVRRLSDYASAVGYDLGGVAGYLREPT